MKRKNSWIVSLACIGALACSGPDTATGPEKAASAKKDGPPVPVQQALEGPASPALLLTQAWFWKAADGSPRPGPARLDIWRRGPSGWGFTRLEDADSNVFHKAVAYKGGILTIGAERALLKKWTFADGQWGFKTLWERKWDGRFNRLRDLEIGDVDGDGQDEFVIATHDAGVVAVIDDVDSDEPQVTEMDGQADTFVHEIEIGDIDGDGKLEFFATPSDRNKAGQSQAGGIVMYRWDGSSYKRSWVEEQHGTHAKEILAHDMDGDGTSELFGVLEAEVDPKDRARLVTPVQVRQYMLGADGKFTHSVVATIDDRQTRFLVPADFDGDGRVELIAAAFKKGLFHLKPPAADAGPDAAWTTTRFDGSSSGFEHAAYAADLNSDGRPELYVAADDQGHLKRYDYDPESGRFDRLLLGKLEPSTLTWNITSGTF